MEHSKSQVRLFGRLSGLETEQPSNILNDPNDFLFAMRNLFEVSDKYDIPAVNIFMTNEIFASASNFPIADLIELGDKFANDSILDAGFQKLSRETAIQLIIEKEATWKQYGKVTQERLIVSLGKLLQADDKIIKELQSKTHL